MNKKNRFILDFILRYFILFLIGIFGIKLFYFIFSSLTVYPVYFFLKLFFDVSLTYNTIIINNLPIEIIGACIAGSAYYLLLILNLSTREIKLERRITILFFSFFLFLVINILRIFFLSLLYINGVSFFDIAHRLFWYAGSVIFVVAIWFLSVKIFKIKEIPFYSDVIFLSKSRNKLKKTKSSKKH
jgi:exosortase/archaeosortase family protein